MFDVMVIGGWWVMRLDYERTLRKLPVAFGVPIAVKPTVCPPQTVKDNGTMTLWSALRCRSSSIGRVVQQQPRLPSYVAGANRHKMVMVTMSSVAEKDNILPVRSAVTTSSSFLCLETNI